MRNIICYLLLVLGMTGELYAQDTVRMCNGTGVQLSINDACDSCLFQWSIRAIDGTSWNILYDWDTLKGVTIDSVNDSLMVECHKDIDGDSVSDTIIYAVFLLPYGILEPPIIISNNTDTLCFHTQIQTLSIHTPPMGGYGGYHYQWQDSTALEGWVDVEGAHYDTLSPGNISGEIAFRLRVNDSCKTVFSNVIQLHMYDSLIVPTIMSDYPDSLCYGTSISLTSVTHTVSYGNIYRTLQWQDSTSVSGWQNVNIENDSIMYRDSIVQDVNYRAICIHRCGNNYSNVLTFYVDSQLFAGEIADKTLCYGDSVLLSFLIHPSGSREPYQYQWQQKDSIAPFCNISEATIPTYQTNGLQYSHQYRVIVSSALGCSDTTPSALVTVLPQFIPGTINEGDTVICYNTQPDGIGLTHDCLGGLEPYSYQWQESSNGTIFNDIIDSTRTAYQPDALTSTRYYRLSFISQNDCPIVYSNVVRDSVRDDMIPAVVRLGGNDTVCYDSVPQFAINIYTFASGSTETFSYQWQSNNGSGWRSIPNATQVFYFPPALHSSTRYRVASSDICTTKYSNNVKVNVYEQLNTGSLPSEHIICYGDRQQLSISTPSTGGGNRYFYRWHASSDDSLFLLCAETTNPTYLTDTLMEDKYYKVESVSKKGCGSVFSNSSHIRVAPLFRRGLIGSSDTICWGQSPHQLAIRQECTGGVPPYYYQWQLSTDGQLFGNIDHAEVNYYQPSQLKPDLDYTTDPAHYYYRLQFVSSNGCGSDYSDTVSIRILPLPMAKRLFGDASVCRNAYNEVYYLDTVQDNVTYQWSVSGGIFEDEYTLDSVSVHWGMDAGDGILFLHQTNTNTLCERDTCYVIEKTEDLAPNKTSIIRKRNTNILICEDDRTDANYEWGYINRKSRQTFYIPNSNCRYIELPHEYDTSKYEYFVIIHYGNSPCNTTTYYIKDVLLETDNPQLETTMSIAVFPNPTHGYVKVKVNNFFMNEGTLQVVNMLGQCVYHRHISREDFFEDIVIPTDNMKGNHLVVFRTDKYVSTTKMTVR